MLSLFKPKAQEHRKLPAIAQVRSFVDDLTIALFPVIDCGRSRKIKTKKLRKKLGSILSPLEKRLDDPPSVIAERFIGRLDDVRKDALSDARFIAEGDPASEGVEEVIMAYPGFFGILVYRLANRLFKMGVPLVPRIMTEYAHSITGIDIHPGATIGTPFFIDHGTGIVIGETAWIGDRVKIYQGVTLGALSVSKSAASSKRHPTIEEKVIIYAGSTILGGKTVIGHHSVIGGNVWLTKSVPPHAKVYNESKVSIKENNKK